MRKSKNKTKLRKLRKKIHYFIPIFLVFVFLISDLHTIDVRCESNYSNYMESESILVENDRALILLESASSSNNYRNYFETNFLFPYKLHEGMYSTQITSNPAKYYFSQVYLNNLDSDYAFSHFSSNDQYNSSSFVANYTDLSLNNGNYYNHGMESLILLPNVDIVNQWETTFSNHYGAVNTTPAEALYIDGTTPYNNEIESFGFTTLSDYSFDTITIAMQFEIEMLDFDSKLYGNLTSNDILLSNFEFEFLEYSIHGIREYNITLESFYDTAYIDDLEICFQMNSTNEIYEVFYLDYIYLNISNSNYNSEVLKYNDYSYYNFESEFYGSGSGSGNYTAEYSFDTDANGSNPSGWTCYEPSGTSIQVISDKDSHNKVVEFYDGSGSYFSQIQKAISQINGVYELWFYTTDITKASMMEIQDGSNSHRLLLIIDDSKIQYYDGSYHDITSMSSNNWYHFEIVFDCSSSWYVEINDVLYGNYTFQGSPSEMDMITLGQNSNADSGYYTYLDAIDNYYADGYYRHRNYYDSYYSVNGSSNLEIEYSGNNYDNLERLEIEYSVKSNVSSGGLYLYLYSQISKSYELVKNSILTTSFQEFTYSFDLNYTFYSRLGIIDFILVSESSTFEMISFDVIRINALFSNYTLNDNGYHDLEIKFLRETSGLTHRGNMTLNLQLYKDHFDYTYSEINAVESSYYSSDSVNFSSYLSENITECEIQAHIRFGLNTLDVEIINVYYLILINYEYQYEIFEQIWNGNLDGNYFKYKFAYTSENFNRLNNTGIFGNYSSSNLKGMRVLKANTDQSYNRYFTIPYFDEKVSLTSGVGAGGSGAGGSGEPQYPSGKYWSYETFRVVDGDIVQNNIGNWSYDFQQVKVEQYTARFFYREKTIKRSDLGEWKFKISDDWRISFNFMRNALADLINLILLFFQYIYFLVIASLSFILMFLGCNILVLLWNYPLYWLTIAGFNILWYLYLGLITALEWIWEGLVWVYENLLVPFWEWFWEVAFPILIDIFIRVWAVILATILWLITLGTMDWFELYEMSYKLLWQIAEFLIEAVVIFITHIDALLLYVQWYLILTFLCAVKYEYCKSRGFVNRTNQLKYSLEAYLLPIEFAYKAAKWIWEMIPEL